MRAPFFWERWTLQSAFQAMSDDFDNSVDYIMLVVLVARHKAKRCQRDAIERI